MTSSKMSDAMELRQTITRETLPGSTVLVVSDGNDAAWLQLKDRVVRYFPGENTRFGNSSALIDHLEALRSQGADYLVWPASAGTRLRAYEEFVNYLETRCELLHRSDAGMLVSLNTRLVLPDNTFSVVICTYNRADFVGQAIQSVFDQDYPKDKYEVIIINNDSPDDTEQAVAPYLDNAPVPVSYFVEKQNGLSHARNLGIVKARFDFVAHLDDDAIAVPDWLASFNAVINEQHALVVGGRVDIALPEDFVAPDWFEDSYPRGFFGLDCRDQGKNERVFRIRHPLYLGGGNSVYARRLYPFFGGYDPRLGRDGKTLLAGEETYLNMVLDQNDIPMFYSHDAAIDHHIITGRITKEHIESKAHWSGVTNAILETMMFGLNATKTRAKHRAQEIVKLRQQCEASPDDPRTFGRCCRIAHHQAFLDKLSAIRLERLAGKQPYKPQRIDWEPQQWLDAIEALPDSIEKDCQRYHFHRAMRNQSAGDAAYDILRPQLKRVPRERNQPQRTLELLAANIPEERAADAVCRCVEGLVPEQAVVFVVSKGDPRLVHLSGRQGEHFPQTETGEYSGSYPVDSAAAIEHLESLRPMHGNAFLVFPQTAFWWLEHYAGFREHLDSNYGLPVYRDEVCLIYRLWTQGQIVTKQEAGDD